MRAKQLSPDKRLALSKIMGNRKTTSHCYMEGALKSGRSEHAANYLFASSGKIHSIHTFAEFGDGKDEFTAKFTIYRNDTVIVKTLQIKKGLLSLAYVCDIEAGDRLIIAMDDAETIGAVKLQVSFLFDIGGFKTRQS